MHRNGGWVGAEQTPLYHMFRMLTWFEFLQKMNEKLGWIHIEASRTAGLKIERPGLKKPNQPKQTNKQTLYIYSKQLAIDIDVCSLEK